MIERLEPRCLLAAGTGLQGSYFDGPDFTSFKLTRTDPTLDFAWGAASPDAQLAADTFSVRWTGELQPRFTETYSFHVTSDDGVRLWVDGQRLINDWTTHSLATRSASIDLVAGRRYDLVLEYFDNTGNASAKLEWSSVSQAREVVPSQYLFPGRRGGLLREIWSNITGTSLTSLTGNAAYPNSPTSSLLYAAAEIPSNSADNYGDRLRGFVHAPVTGDYTFYIAADDSAALYLSNSTDPAGARQIASVSAWTSPRQWTKYASQKSITIPLVAGQAYYLEALHKEGAQSDHLAIAWQRPGSSAIDVIPNHDLSPMVPEVRLYQLQPRMTEGSEDPARVQVVRSGTNTAAPLTVYYTTAGQALAGTDTAALSGSITIPAGATTAEITVRPLQDSLIEDEESLVITLADRPEYRLATISSQSAILPISDDDFAEPSVQTSAISATPLSAFNVWGTGTSKKLVTVSGPGFTQALEIATTVRPAQPWDIQAQQLTTVPLKKGEAMLLEFTVRATSGTGQFDAIVERAGTPYTKSLSQNCRFGSEWTKFQLPFTMAEDYATGGAQFTFHLGYNPQTIQIGAVRLVNYGAAASMLPTDTVSGWGGIDQGYGTSRTVAVSGMPFSSALELETFTKPANLWNLQALRDTMLPVTAEETLYVEFYARSGTAANAKVTPFFQKAGSPWTKSLAQERTVGSTWTLIRLPFSAAEDYAAGDAQFGFFFGYDPQKVQIGGLKLVRVSTAAPSIAASPLPAFSTPNSAYGTSQVVTVTGAPGGFTEALQITTTAVPPGTRDFRVTQPTTAALRQGDSMFLEFYARSTSTTASARFTAILESTASPYTASLSSTQTVNSNWTLIRLPFTLAADYAAGAATLALNCGFGPQTLQIARVRLIDISQTFAIDLFPTRKSNDTYGGRDAASAWRATADANIQANRKAPLSVTVTDQNGNPIDGVEVILRQKQHEYVFGTAASASMLVRNTTPDGDTYRSMIQRLFNTVVLENALKWPMWLNDRQVAIDAANWVINNDLLLRGHTLVWPSRSNMPSSVWATYDSTLASEGQAAASEYLRTTILAHITDEAGAIKGLPFQWDVVNEPYSNHDAMDVLGNAEMIEWFKAAAAADPDAALYLNDYGIFDTSADTRHQDNFETWINYLLTNNAPLEGIGEQSHFGARAPDLNALQPVIDRYARFGLPIMITEYDQNTTDEQLQADFLRDYFTFIFSQGSINGILQWGFWENLHWRKDCALYRDDWSAKPNGQQYEDLVFGEWWSDVRGTTTGGGVFSADVFKGEYEVIVQRYDTKVTQATVSTDGASIIVSIDATAPTVTTTRIGDGSAQRSMVREITLSFSEPVNLGADPFSLLLRGSASPATITATVLDATSYRLTFSGTGVTGDSLADGLYELRLNPTAITDVAGNPLTGSDSTKFHRLFGDSDGDRDVDAIDYQAFKASFNRPSRYVFYFDFDDNKSITSTDLVEFKKRMLRPVLL